MPRKETPKSTAYRLVELVYRHCWDNGRSWLRLNHCLYQQVITAITAGVDFHPDDFASIWKDFKGSYWFTDATGGEAFYKHAILNYHSDAIQSFENWKDRRPLIIDGQRVFIGREIDWEGKKLIVTSFKDEASAFIACGYKKITRSSYGKFTHSMGEGKPTVRLTISWDDLKGKRARAKK